MKHINSSNYGKIYNKKREYFKVDNSLNQKGILFVVL